MHRRRLLGILTAALLAVPTTALAADATATALHVDGVVTVSSSSEGKATGLEVLGQQVTGTSGNGGTHVASSEDAGVPGDVAEVTVLRTQVDGESSSADAVTVRAGGAGGVQASALSSSRNGSGADTQAVTLSGRGHRLTVGDSRVDADGGSTAVLDADGTRVLTDEDTDGELCGAEVPQVLRAELLCVESLPYSDEAAVVRSVHATPAGTDLGLPSLTVLRANGLGAPTTTGEQTPLSPPPSRPSAPVVPSTPVTTATTPGGPGDGPLAAPTPAPTLPTAGASTLGILTAALGSIAAGAGLLRRRRTA